MRIKYSPDAASRLRDLKTKYGKKRISNITKAIHLLKDNPRMCPKVRNLIGIVCPYFLLHIEQHCIFYKVEDDIVYISKIYHEKEDILMKLFGISSRTDESIDYWGE